MNSSSCAAWTQKKRKKKVWKHSAEVCVDTDRTTGSGWVMHEWIQVSGKWRILTYCCRNVSVGRVIGIHIGRVMGGREHSVVVDSECWTKTMEVRQWFTPTEDTREQWQETTGGTWCAGMRRSDAELSALWRLFLLIWGFFFNSEWLHTSDSSLYPIPL